MATVVGSGMVLVVTTVVVDGGFGGLVVGAGGLKLSPLLEDLMGIGISRLVVWLVKVAAVISAVVVIAADAERAVLKVLLLLLTLLLFKLLL